MFNFLQAPIFTTKIKITYSLVASFAPGKLVRPSDVQRLLLDVLRTPSIMLGLTQKLNQG